jgi:2-keto-4-pentenoate hydratase/2-oxohepta-3-ene-1,7-dioic acid hydratase in catechol pathway
MRLVSFTTASGGDAHHVGVLVPLGAAVDTHTHVCDLTEAFANDGGGTPLTGGMRQLLQMVEGGGMARATAAASSGRWRIARSSITLRAPISDPEKIICVGMNYYDHCTEQNFPIPKEPVLFSKFASSISGPSDVVPLEDDLTSELDFEVELAIVIGRRGRRIAKEDALEHIAGWTVAHDVSARDLQMKRNGGQWLLGKTGDGYAPIGPAIVTRDEGAAFSDASSLPLRTFLNGAIVQSSNTRELIHTPADVVAYASKYFTLNVGDLIFTGTPGGVGVFRKPPIFLKHGDEVIVEIDGIGRIVNPIRAVSPAETKAPNTKRAKL